MEDFDLDLSAALPLLNTASQVLSPSGVTSSLLYAADRVGAAAEELMPGASSQQPYPPQTHNPLPLYYDRMTAPVYKYKMVNGKRTRTSEIAKPPQPYKSKFKSLKQQRYVMAMVSKGQIPYRRTGTLGKSFTHSQPVVITPGLVQVSVGTNLSYAPYVVGKGTQSHYHQGNWPTLEFALASHYGDLEAVAVSAIIYDIKRRLRNG